MTRASPPAAPCGPLVLAVLVLAAAATPVLAPVRIEAAEPVLQAVAEVAAAPPPDSRSAAEGAGRDAGAEAPAPGEAASESAPDAIARFNATLLDIMKRSDELGYEGRYETVAPVVRDTFDVAFMAAKTIGSTWRRLDPAERRRWVDAFEGYTVSNFADRFDGFSGETLEIVGQKPASHETLVVLTRLTRPGDDDVELNYRMREDDAGWKVVDIYADGTVSEIALRRSEYASVLRQGGIEKLIASVEAKTAERARGGD